MNPIVLRAAEVMQTEVKSLSPKMPIVEAVDWILREGFSGAPVVDDDGVLIGLLTEKDCLQVMSSAAYHGTPEGTVEDHMVQEVTTIAPDVDLFRLTYLFIEYPYRRVLVTDTAGHVLGILARRDILAALDKVRVERERHAPKTTYEVMEERRG